MRLLTWYLQGCKYIDYKPVNWAICKQLKPSYNVAQKGLHCLLRQKTVARERHTIIFGNYYLWHLNIYNGPLCLNCIKTFEKCIGIQRVKLSEF